jgi:hypothetical protein
MNAGQGLSYRDITEQVDHQGQLALSAAHAWHTTPDTKMTSCGGCASFRCRTRTR